MGGDVILDAWDDGTVGDSSESPHVRVVWRPNDRVRIIGGSPQLLGAVGTVVEVGLPGRWPIRVQVEGRRGFGEVQRAADELAPEDESAS
jgi:hypothetical protein